MSEYGITSAGFIRKPFSVIKQELETKARELFGDDMDLSVYSPAGLFVQLLAWNNNIIWQELENSYYANWLDTAEGVNLDRAVEWGGISRKQAEKGVLQDVVFSGTTGTVIPQGFVIETLNGVQFKTVAEGAIDNSGPDAGKGIKAMDCIALLPGQTGSVEANTVTQIVASLSGVESVTNPYASVGAADIETDAELRARYRTEGAEGVGSSIDAIKSAIMKVENVVEAAIYENTGTGDDAEGRPAKSIECVVLYPDDDPDAGQKVGYAIFETKPAGIETFGSLSETVLDIDNKPYTIKFNKPSLKNIYVTLDLDVNDLWKASYASSIKTNVIEYIGGVNTQTIDGQDIQVSFKGLSINEDVFAWRIAAVNNKIPGIEKVDVRIGFAADPSETIKLLIGVRELARCSNDFIIINTTPV